MAKKYNTERYNILLQIQRIFRHISNKGSILTVQNKSKVNLHLTVYEYIIVYKYILLSNFIYIYIDKSDKKIDKQIDRCRYVYKF